MHDAAEVLHARSCRRKNSRLDEIRDHHHEVGNVKEEAATRKPGALYP